MSQNGFKVMFRNLAGERVQRLDTPKRGLSRWHKKLNEVKALASKALRVAGEGWGVLGMPPRRERRSKVFLYLVLPLKEAYFLCNLIVL